MANQALKKLNYQIGKICRLSTRRIKLMAINNRRKQQLRHLGERIYILKTLQQDDNIWEKDEIAQLMLTIADLDQEIEMIIEEINEIKAETPPEDLCCGCQEDTGAAAPAETETAPPAPSAPAEEKPAVTVDEKKEDETAKPATAKKSPAKSGTAKKTETKTTKAKAPAKRKSPAKKTPAAKAKESKEGDDKK
ncbi:MAG: hypothetical protein GXO34_01835 [Deltaproteobacteria bacterium]|nr:hypothetical protein [Deltaproteobacteria bacterium]